MPEVTEPWLVPISDGGKLVQPASNHPTTSQLHSARLVTESRSLALAQNGGQTASKTTQGNAMHDGSNRSLGERISDALMEAAEARNTATIARRKADRIYDALFVKGSGAIELRKANARLSDECKKADWDAMQAEHQANIAKARVDAIMCEYELFRTLEATERAKMRIL